jgi:hypothetical protein
VLQEGTVSALRATSDRVRQESEQNRTENLALAQELGRYRSLATAVLPDLVRGRLQDRPVVLVDTDKVDGGVRDGVRKVLEDAGAEVDGQVTFAAGRLALDAQGDRTALGRLLAADAADAEVLRGELVEKLADRLATPRALPREGQQPASDVLTALQDADFLADLKLSRAMADGTAPFPRQGSIFVLIGPTDGAPVAPEAFLVPLADRISARAAGPVAGVEAAAAGILANTSSWVVALRDRGELSRRVSGIDAVDTAYGQLALVQALQDELQQLPAGQYGLKAGASSLLPEKAGGS